MVQNFEAYGVEITVEKPIAVCVACSFCVNIDMAVDKNVTHFCEILGKLIINLVQNVQLHIEIKSLQMKRRRKEKC